MINNQAGDGDEAANNATSPLRAAGYTFAYDTDNNFRLNTNETVRATKLMQYLLEKSPEYYLTSISTSNDGRAAGVFWRDDISNYTHTSYMPDSGIPMIINEDGDVTTFIDLENRIFWMGESEHFGDECEGDQLKFCINICDFLAKAAGYGSHFTDLLLETGTDFGDGRVAQPAPWDDYWDDTANGGTDNRLMPKGQ
jgi:hypothetical protein